MKKIVSIMVAACLCIISSVCFVGCGEYKDKSNAAELGQFDRPDYAAEMEAKNDAELTHIEIPDDAETVTVNGVEYKPIESLKSILNDFTLGDFGGNYILKNDVEYDYGLYKQSWDDAIVFSGKLHGNNYKLYGEMIDVLFFITDNAIIENLIISSKATGSYKSSLVGWAHNSVIKNVINYAGSCEKHSAIIGSSTDCTIDGCINYADLHTYNGTIVGYCLGKTTIKNCKNFGNISCADESDYEFSGVGGIVGDIGCGSWSGVACQVVVENCENFGDLIGVCNTGGIVGWHNQADDRDDVTNIFKPDFPESYVDESIIKNCKNYGNIYRKKRDDDLLKYYTSGFGGITGIGTKIENCTNSGSIYGFETVDPDWQVEYVGGICGAAVSVESCENTGEFNVSSLVNCSDSICGYIIK